MTFIAILLVSSLLLAGTPVPADGSITLVAAGDNLIHSSIYKDAKTAGGYDFTPIYSEVKEIVSEADVAMINQETPLGDGGFSGYPRFCSPKQVGDALAWAGFDVINIANNHMLDRGDEGLRFTAEYLSSVAEAVIGRDRESISVIVRNDIRVGFVAFTYSTNCDGYSDIPRLTESNIRSICGRASGMCDILVASVHWGVEFDSGRYVSRFEPTEDQREKAALLCECGVGLIIGSHPHVLQDAEWIVRGDKRALCVYSLGNFVSNMRYGVQMLGGLLEAKIVRRGGKIFVSSAKIIPTVCHFSQAHRGYVVYPLAEYTDKLASAHGTRDESNEKPFCLDTLYLYYENNIGADFRDEIYRKEEEKNDKP